MEKDLKKKNIREPIKMLALIAQEGMKEITMNMRLRSVPAENLTGNNPNTSLDRYRLDNVFDNKVYIK
jgi:hypothetical protein